MAKRKVARKRKAEFKALYFGPEARAHIEGAMKTLSHALPVGTPNKNGDIYMFPGGEPGILGVDHGSKPSGSVTVVKGLISSWRPSGLALQQLPLRNPCGEIVLGSHSVSMGCPVPGTPDLDLASLLANFPAIQVLKDRFQSKSWDLAPAEPDLDGWDDDPLED